MSFKLLDFCIQILFYFFQISSSNFSLCKNSFLLNEIFFTTILFFLKYDNTYICVQIYINTFIVNDSFHLCVYCYCVAFPLSLSLHIIHHKCLFVCNTIHQLFMLKMQKNYAFTKIEKKYIYILNYESNTNKYGKYFS